MATKIRLRRMGARNTPFYRLVVADSRFATTGRNLEVLGWYDPRKADKNFSVKVDRVDYWLETGAQLSSTAKSLVKKARAGEGVEPGAVRVQKPVDTPPLVDEVPEPVDEPTPATEEIAAEASGEDSAEEAPETATEEAPEKQES